MPVFIKKDDFIDVTVLVGKDGFYYEDGDQDSPKDCVEERFTFRRPSWGDVKKILSSSSVVSPEGAYNVDLWKFIDGRLKALLVGWSLKDAEGKPVQVSTETIDSLDPKLTTFLNDRLDATLGNLANIR